MEKLPHKQQIWRIYIITFLPLWIYRPRLVGRGMDWPVRVYHLSVLCDDDSIERIADG